MQGESTFTPIRYVLLNQETYSPTRRAIAHLLVEQERFDANHLLSGGNSILHLGAQIGDVKLVKMLLKKTPLAVVCVRNSSGLAALQVGTRRGRNVFEKFFENEKRVRMAELTKSAQDKCKYCLLAHVNVSF